ncbi:MAG: type II toxin-antitoxin system HipA family toxin YjjJ [Opitutaceae bacterium]|nr:type II toxin-antitoxin system HipA family toxin YjjJ [Opitutaceae bacterium]
MARPIPDPRQLTLILQVRGALSGRALAEAMGVSEPTVTRLIKRLGSSIERVGAARSSRYLLRRVVRNFGDQWPVYRLDADGRPRVWGQLRALHGGFRFIPQGPAPAWMQADYPDGLFSGLPFFLQEVRPQGYLGRAIARDFAARQGAPTDLRQWNDDDVLSYFLTDGHDLPGDMIVGDRAMERAHRSAENVSTTAVANDDRSRVYPEQAAAAQRGELIGSSAGGEQPKFLTHVSRQPGQFQSVLVKFSSADPSPVSQRWADLLRCEHLASETMRARGIIAARTEIIDAGGRRFLEVERFDRINACGRRGMISLGALEDAFLAQPSADWSVAASLLEGEGWISAAEARSLRWIWCFGDLIANTDMHRANASFWFGEKRPFTLTRFYDMLPMLYAPGSQGDLSERAFFPRPPLASVLDVWPDAATAAAGFWERAGADAGLAPSFRAIAQANLLALRRLMERFV